MIDKGQGYVGHIEKGVGAQANYCLYLCVECNKQWWQDVYIHWHNYKPPFYIYFEVDFIEIDC